jgi:hypothetical protein
VTWIGPDVERSEDYPERRNEPEQDMLRDRPTGTGPPCCANARLTPPSCHARRGTVEPPLLGLVRTMSDTERGWVRQTYRGQVPDLYYRSGAPDADFEEPTGYERGL